MKIITAPDNYEKSKDETTLFLGGGITDCADWQAKFIAKLPLELDATVLNPRRVFWDYNDKSASSQQIEWEFKGLEQASVRLFWFCPETLCPITLFELGKYCCSKIPLFVGCHPAYKRVFDVGYQLKLARPHDCDVHTNLDDLAAKVIRYLRYWKTED